MAPDSTAGGTGADAMDFPHEYHRSLIEEFVDGVTADRNPPVTGEETLKVHRSNDAVLASNEAGCPVKVERS